MEGKNSRRISSALLAATLSVSTMGAALAKEFYIGGRVRAGTSLAVDPRFDEDRTSFGLTQYLAQIDATWKPSDVWSVDGSLWLRGDFFNAMNDGDFEQSGIQDFTDAPPTGQFLRRFRNSLSADGTGALPNPYGMGDGGENEALSKFEDVFRKFAVTYADPKGRFSATAGKFQRGWGQSDGLRLLDILYAQDLRQRLIFTDSEDLRINAATVALDLNLDAMGMGAPFNAIGMGNTTLELLYIPEVRHAEIGINNPIPTGRTNGGMFGLPFPKLIDGNSGWGIPNTAFNITDKEFDAFEREEWGARLKFDAFGGEATINGFYGYQDLPILELTGSSLIVGNAFNDPSAPGVVAVVPADLATTNALLHAPIGELVQFTGGGTPFPGVGGVLPFLRGVKDIFDGPPFPPGFPPGGFPGGFDNPSALFGCATPFSAGLPCSINGEATADFTYKQKVAGFSFTRDIRELKLGRKNVSPVVRVEFSYEFDKPFQRAAVTPTGMSIDLDGPGPVFESRPFTGVLTTGSGAGLVPIGQSVEERDQNSLMLGFDYFFWVPGWESQQASIFTSSQIFNIHTSDGDELLWQAPYGFTRVEENWNYFSQLWSLPLMDEKLTLEGLFIADIDKNGLAYRQRIDYSLMNGRMKPRLEWGYFDGHEEEGLLGTFGNSDYVEFSINYQF